MSGSVPWTTILHVMPFPQLSLLLLITLSVFSSVSWQFRIKANIPGANLQLYLLAEIPRLKLTSGYQQIDLEQQIYI